MVNLGFNPRPVRFCLVFPSSAPYLGTPPSSVTQPGGRVQSLSGHPPADRQEAAGRARHAGQQGPSARLSATKALRPHSSWECNTQPGCLLPFSSQTAASSRLPLPAALSPHSPHRGAPSFSQGGFIFSWALVLSMCQAEAMFLTVHRILLPCLKM